MLNSEETEQETNQSKSNESNAMHYADLSHLTLQEIQDLRSKIGVKKFNKLYGTRKAIGRGRSQSSYAKSANRSRPTEMSSKKPINTQQLATGKKPVSRDPRFDDLSGEFNETLFKKSYKFIDRLRKKESKEIRKIAEDEEMDDGTRKKAKELLKRMGQKTSAKKEASIEEKVEATLKAERKKAMKEGQKPYFVKPSVKKKLVLAEKYKELKKKGQLESFMKKKRKKNALKSKKNLEM